MIVRPAHGAHKLGNEIRPCLVHAKVRFIRARTRNKLLAYEKVNLLILQANSLNLSELGGSMQVAEEFLNLD